MGTLFATIVTSAKSWDRDYKLSDGAGLYLLVWLGGTKLAGSRQAGTDPSQQKKVNAARAARMNESARATLDASRDKRRSASIRL